MKIKMRNKLFVLFFVTYLAFPLFVQAITEITYNSEPIIYINDNYVELYNGESQIKDELLFSCHSDQPECKNNKYNINGSFAAQTTENMQYSTTAQSMAITDNAEYIIVMLDTTLKDTTTNPDAGFKHQYNSMFILKKEINNTYSKVKIIQGLECGHANGSTYYKDKNGNDYIMVIVEDGTVKKYRMDLKKGEILQTTTIYLEYNNQVLDMPTGIAYDKNDDAFYIAKSNELYKYDTSFSSGTLIRDKSNTHFPGNTIGSMYSNQDIGVYGNYIYSVEFYEKEVLLGMGISADTLNYLTNFSNSEKPTVIVELNKNTGDFSRFIVASVDSVNEITKKYYWKSNKNYSNTGSTKLLEPQDVEFVGVIPYILYQRAGSFQILIPSNNSIGEFHNHYKLFIRYNTNGGSLATSYNDRIGVINEFVVIDNSIIKEHGEFSGAIFQTGLWNYNNINNINIKKTGYTVKKGEEWNTKKDGSGKSFDQSIQYKVSDIADCSSENQIITLYVNWKPIHYTLEFNSNGGLGNMKSQEFIFDETKRINPNEFERTNYTFIGWNTKKDGSGKNYLDEEEISNLTTTDGKTIVLYAQWRMSFEVKLYNIDEIKGQIKSINVGTTLSSYQNKFMLPEGYKINVNLGKKKYIYTGSISKVYFDNQEIQSYENVIKGDINGDGEIGSGDMLKLKRYLLGEIKLKDAYFAASDMNEDNIVNSNDLLKMRQQLLKNK